MLNRQSPGNRRLCHDFDVSLRRSTGLGSFLDRSKRSLRSPGLRFTLYNLSKWSLPSGTPLYTVYPIAVGGFTNAQIDLELCRVPETGDSAMTSMFPKDVQADSAVS